MDVETDCYSDNLQNKEVWYKGTNFAQRSFIDQGTKEHIIQWLNTKSSSSDLQSKKGVVLKTIKGPRRAVKDYIAALPLYPTGAPRAFLQEMSK